jgi:uncharacterized protein (TIGR02265 family)
VTHGAPDDDDVPLRVFEGLFVGAELHPTGAFADALVRCGYDANAPRKAYPAVVWRDAIEVARRHVHPSIPVADGLRALGRAFAAGFGKTVIGRVFRTVAPLFGLERTILSLPRYLHTVRRHMQVEVALEGDVFRLTAVDPYPNPDFIAGCMLGIVDIFERDAEVTITAREAERFELQLTVKR